MGSRKMDLLTSLYSTQHLHAYNNFHLYFVYDFIIIIIIIIIIPIVIGTLGMIPRGLEENLRTLGITTKIELIQKVALLGTA